MGESLGSLILFSGVLGAVGGSKLLQLDML